MSKKIIHDLPTRCIDPVMKCCQDCAWGYREYGDDAAVTMKRAVNTAVSCVITFLTNRLKLTSGRLWQCLRRCKKWH